MAICDYCAKEIDDGTIFCQFCGYNIIPFKLESGITLYHGRYKIVRSLGAGGMASVYLAEDLNLASTQCVIKVMTDEFKDSQEREYAIQKFKDEAVMLARLRHNNLPVVQNHFIEDGKYYLVMDYVEGQTLEDILLETLKNDCLLSEELVIYWGAQVCDILEYLHSRVPTIIHRDVKPENLIEQGDGKIMLLDFGVARIFSKRKTGALGTTGYAAPEQYVGAAYPQSDIFSLGATLHRLLTGYEPGDSDEEIKGNIFVYPPLSEFRDDLNPALQDIISKAMELEAENRFSSAKKFKEALIKLDGKPQEVEILERPSHISNIRKKHKIFDDRKKDSKFKNEVSASLLPEEFKIETSKNPGAFKQKLSEIAGLDIGSYEIKLLQMDVDGKGNIYPKVIASRRTPDNTVVNGMIIDPDNLSNTVKSMVKNMQGTDVIASLSPYCYSIRTIKFPFTSAEQVSTSLSSGLNQLIPLPVEDCYVEYEILTPSITGDERNMKVRVTATRKRAYENLQKTLELSGLNSENIVLESFIITILAKLMINDEAKKRNLAIINMGSDGSSLSLIRDGTLSQTSFFPYGSKIFTQAIMQAERASYEKAEEIKKSECDADITWSKSTGLLQTLLPHFRNWTDNILKALKYFGPDYKMDKFDSIIFCGGGMQLKNLHKHINSQLKIDSELFFLPKSAELSDNCKQLMLEKGPSLMPSMGLIISCFKDIREIQEILGINKTLYKLTSFNLQEKEKVPVKLPVVLLSKETFEKLKNYLSSIVGPIGEKVLEECVTKAGYTKENIPINLLDELVEDFIKEFSLTEIDIAKISRKLQELKVGGDSDTVLSDEKKKIIFQDVKSNKVTSELLVAVNKETLQEMKTYLASIAGPMAGLVLEECIKKSGYTEETIPVKDLDNLGEVFSREFGLPEGKSLKIREKLLELKNRCLRVSNEAVFVSDEKKTISQERVEGKEEKTASQVLPVVNKETLVELRTHMASIAGPMAGPVLEECIKKSGYTEETIPVGELDNLVEAFSKEFDLPESKVSIIKEKLEKVKAIRNNGAVTPLADDKKDRVSKKKSFLSSLFRAYPKNN